MSKKQQCNDLTYADNYLDGALMQTKSDGIYMYYVFIKLSMMVRKQKDKLGNI